MRIDHACRMLQSPSMTITEIAMSCGYQNISNFNRQFLAIRNMNPTEYRQRFRMKERRPPPMLRAVR
jgi:transcriptional regulator GlxA family with amidase domain